MQKHNIDILYIHFSRSKAKKGNWWATIKQFLFLPGVGVEGAGCECTHLLFSASAALLWQHLLCCMGPQAGYQRGGCVCTASLSHPHHPEGNQGNAETTVVQSKTLHFLMQIRYLWPCCMWLHPCIRPHECFSLVWQQTFEEAEKGFDETLAKEKGMNRDDRVHGALLILNELVRISSMEGEVRAEFSVGTFSHQQTNHSSHLLHSCAEKVFSFCLCSVVFSYRHIPNKVYSWQMKIIIPLIPLFESSSQINECSLFDRHVLIYSGDSRWTEWSLNLHIIQQSWSFQ